MSTTATFTATRPAVSIPALLTESQESTSRFTGQREKIQEQHQLLHPLPKYHLKAPRGWINDPCAPGYDARTGTYHLYYQWNPNSCDWGDIVWGQFTSKDGVHWSSPSPSLPPPSSQASQTPQPEIQPVLKRDQPYDKDGVFTGCFHPTGPSGEEDQLTIFYTSVCHLPLHWTLPHTRGAEGLAMATSKDGGKTWTKFAGNPIIKAEPDAVEVTGFRDPFLAPWPAMDRARGIETTEGDGGSGGGKRTLYGAISGGIRDQGPNVFLYAVQEDNLAEWTYLGPLMENADDVEGGLPFRLSPKVGGKTLEWNRWSGNLGVNWECANFMTLRSQPGADSTAETKRERDFLVTGAEGGLKPGADEEKDENPYGQWSMWMAGTLAKREGGDGVVMRHEYSGFLDHGCFYAASSYEHPTTKQRIVWGWLKEEDLTLKRREQKGWTGYLSMPRELSLQTVDDVVGVVGTQSLEEITSLGLTKIAGSRMSVETMGIRPLPDMQAYRQRQSPDRSWKRPAANSKFSSLAGSTTWELNAVISIPRDAKSRPKRIGFSLHHGEQSLGDRTSIYYSPDDGRLVVDRSLSNSQKDIQKAEASGPLALFVTSKGGCDAVEPLHLRIFRDGDILEIFANDRFALSTMVYSGAIDSGISTFREGAEGQFESAELWHGLGETRTISEPCTEATRIGRAAL